MTVLNKNKMPPQGPDIPNTFGDTEAFVECFWLPGLQKVYEIRR